MARASDLEGHGYHVRARPGLRWSALGPGPSMAAPVTALAANRRENRSEA